MFLLNEGHIKFKPNLVIRKVMKCTVKVAYLAFIHVLAVVGVVAMIWAYNYFIEWKMAGKIYSINIIKIRQGMNIREARALMGELNLDERFHAKVSYQKKVSSADTSTVIVLSYIDSDHTDGSPSIFVNPETEQVEAIQLGTTF